MSCFHKCLDAGGFGVFFMSPGGNLATDVVHALETIGAGAVSKLLLRSMTAFPNAAPSVSLEARQNAIRRLPPEALVLWNDLDGQYAALQSELLLLLRAYVGRNVLEFRRRTDDAALSVRSRARTDS